MIIEISAVAGVVILMFVGWRTRRMESDLSETKHILRMMSMYGIKAHVIGLTTEKSTEEPIGVPANPSNPEPKEEQIIEVPDDPFLKIGKPLPSVVEEEKV